MRKLACVLGVLGTLFLSACGGEATLGSDVTGGDGTTVKIKTVVLLVSSTQLSSNASDVSSGITMTAVVRDENNVVVADVPVIFSTPDSGEINAANPATTDANGRVAAVLTTGGDPTNRTIKVSATADNIKASQTITVIGTTISVAGPESTQSGADAPYVIQITDASGDGIPNVSISASATNGAAVTPPATVTDASGVADITLTAGTQNTVLTVSALGEEVTREITVSPDQMIFTVPDDDLTEVPLGSSQPLTVQWLRNGSPVPNGTIVNFSTTRGTLSATAVATSGGTATVSISANQAGKSTIIASSSAFTMPSTSRQLEFVSTTPAKISVQAFPANMSTNQTSSITVIVRDANDNPVKNAIVDFTLVDATAGTLSAPSAVTNSLGVGTLTYTATSLVSATDGVQVTGTVRGTGLDDTALITVGGQPVSIVLGTGAELGVKDTSTYAMPWTVLVTDSSGNPVPDADFTLSARVIRYIKGLRSDLGDPTKYVVCENEDVNWNDFLDGGEDANGNGLLDPGRVASIPNSIELDEDGAGQADLTYAKEYGEFTRVRLIATARVAGSETTEVRDFWLSVTIDDAPFLPNEGPHGTDFGGSNCAFPVLPPAP